MMFNGLERFFDLLRGALKTREDHCCIFVVLHLSEDGYILVSQLLPIARAVILQLLACGCAART
jgi:hypothetical protein